MTVKKIDVQYPKINDETFTANIEIVETRLESKDNFVLQKKDLKRNNIIFLVLDNWTRPALLKIKGKEILQIEIPCRTSVIPIEPQRLCLDDDIKFEFITDEDHNFFNGTVYAIAQN